MRSNKIIFVLCAFAIVTALIFNFSGCVAEKLNENINEQANTSNAGSSDNELSNIVYNKRQVDQTGITDFSLELFKRCSDSKKNTLISPVSVLFALAMTENGAEGNTLAQMQNTIGMDIDKLNPFLRDYVGNLPQGEKYRFDLANSIWFEENFDVDQSFLDINKSFYGADIFKVPFTEETKDNINGWVNEKTRKMIPHILDSIPENAVMYLINALAFEAEWAELYTADDVEPNHFTLEDGTKKKISLMSSTENTYLKDDNASGFIKYFSGNKYAFAALLPDEGVKLDDYVESLDGQKINSLLTSPTEAKVNVKIPKFEINYGTEMKSVIESMGITDAFSPNLADFSGISPTAKDDGLCISRIIHKTFMEVSEKGTKAAAVTLVEMKNECIFIPAESDYTVHLDRPFVYMLIDCENNIPFFIGTAVDIGK